MTKFKKGMVVQLKSGGPKMTVREAENQEDICCEYWDEKSKLFKTNSFNEDELEEVVKNDSANFPGRFW